MAVARGLPRYARGRGPGAAPGRRRSSGDVLAPDRGGCPQGDIPEDDRAFLRKRARELRDRVEDLRFESERGPVHGDAHVQNLMVDRNDQVIMIDLERFSFDHPSGV
ncbi:phosphotransferase [Streptomyces sp. ISID311]|uniref:phosphotransferase family protein n=1 Tax=Streptomyces sp. ISID311 TaxID=2601673 RepID=UPI0011BD2F91|nr:phosphotransferase [Streptomyces sp. ISID311]